MKDFFISYNKNDRCWAEWLAWTLEEAGFTVIIQAWDFKPGEDFVQRMEDALNETRRLIAVLSQDYFDARFTNAEWRAVFERDASGSKRALLPIRVKECDLPRLLRTRIYVDLVGLTEEDARLAVIKAADESRGRPLSRPSFPGSEHKRSDVNRVARYAKPYPGVAYVSSSEGPESAPNIGAGVSKNCDREEQAVTFETAFREGVRRCRGYPQMHVVHGPARERHSSLVEHLRETLIQEYANHLAGSQKAAVGFWELKWPTSGKVETDLSRLIEWLTAECDSKYRWEHHDYTAGAFRELALTLKEQVIVVQHEVDAARWTRGTDKLIAAYLRFWDEVKTNADIPLFLIFLNVEYPSSQIGNLWKIWDVVERLRRARANRQIIDLLSRIGNTLGRRPEVTSENAYCLYTLLQELSPVRLEDVEKWFRKHRLGRNEVAWETQSRNIFRMKGWKFTERKNMADVEDALEDFMAVLHAGSNPNVRVNR
jgi:hypothetical protein